MRHPARVKGADAHNLGLVSIDVEAGRFIARHTLVSPPVVDPWVLEPITVHRVPLDPEPAEQKPTLQA